MRRKIYSLVALISFIVLSAGIAYGTTLYSGISHSDYLAPIQEEHANNWNQRLQGQATQQQAPAQQATAFTPQAQVAQLEPHHYVPRLSGNESYVKELGPSVQWFMIPKWMAGQWRKRGDLTVSYHDLRTNQRSNLQAWTDNDMSVLWGQQMDKAGNIWHAQILPIQRDGFLHGKVARFLTVSLTCEYTNPEQLVTRSRYMVTESLLGTNHVTDMFQQESLNDYVLLPTGEMENVSSNRMFASNGQPLREGGLVSKFQRTGPFAPMATQNGIDLAASLKQYLESHGMANLAVGN